MDKATVQKVVEEARSAEANLVIWDKRDTFTVEPKAEISAEDDFLKIEMEDGKATVFVEFDSIYKLVIERERAARPGVRAGFGAASG